MRIKANESFVTFLWDWKLLQLNINLQNEGKVFNVLPAQNRPTWLTQIYSGLLSPMSSVFSDKSSLTTISTNGVSPRRVVTIHHTMTFSFVREVVVVGHLRVVVVGSREYPAAST